MTLFRRSILCAVAAVSFPNPTGAATNPFDIADITWNFGPTFPDYRKAGAVGFVNGMVVASGGSGVPNENPQTYGYTPGGNSWQSLPPMPLGMAYLDGITVGNSMITVGGRTGGPSTGSTRTNVYKFSHNGSTFTWGTEPSLIQSRGYHTLALSGSTIFTSPGAHFTNGNPPDWPDRETNTLEYFNTANPGAGWALTPPHPGVTRVISTVGAAKGKVYVFGGTHFGRPGEGFVDDRLHDAYSFDPATNTWTTLPSLPFGYTGGDAVTYRDRYIIICGGFAEISEQDAVNYPPREPGYYNNMVIIFDTVDNSYHIMPTTMPHGTNDIRTVLVGNTIYALGGESLDTSTSFTSNSFRIGQITLGGPGQWFVDASADWHSASSWSTTIPNGPDAIANLLGTISTARTVNLNQPTTVGFMNFENANAYTIGGTSTLTFQVSSGSGVVVLGAGSHSITAPISIASSMTVLGTGTLTTGNITNAATLSVRAAMSAGHIGGTGFLEVFNNRTLTAASIRQGTLSVGTGATARLAPNGTNAATSKVAGLNLNGTTNAWTGKLDLGDNGMVVDYPAGSPLTTIQNQIKTAFASGSWSGNGITSSLAQAAASNPTAKKTGIGYADSSQLSGLGGSFMGQSFTGGAVLMRYTLFGDANLDATVNALDFNALATNFGLGTRVWFQGDFNYDTTVNTADFNMLALNFGQTLAPSAALSAVVPEPGGILALAGAFVGFRRRGRSA